MSPLRRGFSLIEMLVALAVLSALTIPVVSSLLSARYSLHSSSRDVQAVVLASRMMSSLEQVPYPHLPALGADAASDLPGPEPGIYRSRWRDVYMSGGEDPVDLVALLGEGDPEGYRSYVWIQAVPEDRLGLAAVPCKQLVVSVLYRASGEDVEVERRYTLRGVVSAAVE